MGSFFNTIAKLDPIQQLAGKNSFIAKQDSYDPLMKNTDLGQAYANRHNTGPQAPTPYAGITPTLADAAAGYKSSANPALNTTGAVPNANAYVQQAQRVAQQQQQTPKQQAVGWGNVTGNPYGNATY